MAKTEQKQYSHPDDNNKNKNILKLDLKAVEATVTLLPLVNF